MKKMVGMLAALLVVGAGLAAGVAVSDGGRDAPKAPTATVQQPRESRPEPQTTTTDVNVDPGTVTVAEDDEDDVEQIEAVVSREFAGVDQSDVEDVQLWGDQATATLTDGRKVSVEQRDGRWQPQGVERPSREQPQASPAGGQRDPGSGRTQ